MTKIEKKEKTIMLILHMVTGAIVLLPAAWLIFPPDDSGLNVIFWKERWSTEHVKAFAQAPLRAFTPIPAWWSHNNWNTHFLMEEQHDNNFLRILNLVISLIILLSGVYFFKDNRKSLALFVTNLFISFLIAVMVFPFTRERYAGFLFIGFVVAYWLYSVNTPGGKSKKIAFIIFLILQIPGSVLMILKDIQHPFSNGYRIKELINKVPVNEKIVTDYWAVNVVNTFSGRQLYCIDMEKEIPFILWGQDLSAMLNKPNRYTDGAKNLFKKENLKKMYMISTGAPQLIFQTDPELSKSFNVTLVDKIDGAINKGGNLYLYEITHIN